MSDEPPRPIISDDLVELFASGVDLYVATRSAELVPESVVGMGIRVHADRRTVTLYIPSEYAERTFENLDDNGEIAATLCRPIDHRTVQLKGRCLGVRQSTEADRDAQQVFRAALVNGFSAVGISRAVTRSMPWWPSHAVDCEVRDAFAQTPGPHAGERLSG